MDITLCLIIFLVLVVLGVPVAYIFFFVGGLYLMTNGRQPRRGRAEDGYVAELDKHGRYPHVYLRRHLHEPSEPNRCNIRRHHGHPPSVRCAALSRRPMSSPPSCSPACPAPPGRHRRPRQDRDQGPGPGGLQPAGVPRPDPRQLDARPPLPAVCPADALRPVR